MPPLAGERWCRKAPKGECISNARQGGCMVFAAKGGIKNGAHKGAHIASAAVLHNSRGRSPQPVREASAGPEQNPGNPGPKGPAAGSTLTPVRACQPSGILESTAQVPIPIPTAPQAPEPSSPVRACPYKKPAPKSRFLFYPRISSSSATPFLPK